MEDDDSNFSDLVPGVKRLRNDRINVYQQREKHKPVLRPSSAETSSPEPSYVTTSEAKEAYFNNGIQKKLQRKIRQGLIRPQASLDLHGYRQNDAIEAMNQFIYQALNQGDRMVIIIHGQGYRSQTEAVLKPLVQRWLASHSQVLAWCPAQIRDGAGGASYVYLKAL